MKALICCEYSGVVRDALAALGHDAWSCDLLDSDRPGKHIRADFRSVIQETWDFVGYHYECRVMANSGVRWLYEIPGRWDELNEACEMFNITLRDTRPGYSENPIQHKHAKSLIDREQDQVIQPWWFGDPYFKATCMWYRGDFDGLVPTNKLTPPMKGSDEYKKWSMIHLASPGPLRWKVRSKTFPGIANAIADQMSKKIHGNA